MTVHETAKAGFGAGAEAYERGRPSYPAAAMRFLVERLQLGPDRVVVDIGAGTGKLTELLVTSGAAVIAVEPVAAMRERLTARLASVEAVDGTAEATGLAPGSADAITVAQAFHWFDHQPALAEIARILRPGGHLALIWNRRDKREPWVARLSEVLDWDRGHSPSYGDVDWPGVIDESGRFGPVEVNLFDWVHEMDRPMLDDRVRSISYIAAMAPEAQQKYVDGALALVADQPEHFVMPYRTQVFTCTLR